MTQVKEYLLFLKDDDECIENIDGCAQMCYNTVGSYTCSCADGYGLNSDGFSCNGEIYAC